VQRYPFEHQQFEGDSTPGAAPTAMQRADSVVDDPAGLPWSGLSGGHNEDMTGQARTAFSLPDRADEAARFSSFPAYEPNGDSSGALGDHRRAHTAGGEDFPAAGGSSEEEMDDELYHRNSGNENPSDRPTHVGHFLLHSTAIPKNRSPFGGKAGRAAMSGLRAPNVCTTSTCELCSCTQQLPAKKARTASDSCGSCCIGRQSSRGSGVVALH